MIAPFNPGQTVRYEGNLYTSCYMYIDEIGYYEGIGEWFARVMTDDFSKLEVSCRKLVPVAPQELRRQFHLIKGAKL